METITIVGAGVAGLTAAITCAEAGAPVVLEDAHAAPGGRARSLDGRTRPTSARTCSTRRPAVALAERARSAAAGHRPPVHRPRLRWDGELHRTPPLSLIPPAQAARAARAGRRELPRVGRRATRTSARPSCCGGRGRLHLPPRSGRALRGVRLGADRAASLSPPPAVRFVIGGWSALIAALVDRARGFGVTFRLGERVTELPRDARDRRRRAARRPRVAATTRCACRAATPSASTSRSSTAAATRSSSPTSTSAAGSSATPRPTRRWRRAGRSWSRRRCRSGRASPDAAAPASTPCSTSRSPTAPPAPPGTGGWSWTAAPARSTSPDDLARPPGHRPRRRRVHRGRLGGRAGLLTEVAWASAVEAGRWRSPRRRAPVTAPSRVGIRSYRRRERGGVGRRRSGVVPGRIASWFGSALRAVPARVAPARRRAARRTRRCAPA